MSELSNFRAIFFRFDRLRAFLSGYIIVGTPGTFAIECQHSETSLYYINNTFMYIFLLKMNLEPISIHIFSDNLKQIQTNSTSKGTCK